MSQERSSDAEDGMGEDTLRLLSGGAAQGLVAAVAPLFEARTGFRIEGTFGAVGAMRDRLVAGEPTDLVILTASLVRDLAAAGLVMDQGWADLGLVDTAVAVREGDATPTIASGEALRTALLDADAIYIPDPVKSTAGIHVQGVLDRLGIEEIARHRVRSFPNGATAMAGLAKSSDRRPIGCTQTTEILATPGLALVGPFPPGYDLATVYTAAACRSASHADAAGRLIRLLGGPESSEARERAGFRERLPVDL